MTDHVDTPPLHSFTRAGLTFEVVDGGPRDGEVVVLLHGFPEDATAWSAVSERLHAKGFRTLAPDQRGYGGTRGWDDRYDGDVAAFRNAAYARDALGVVSALGLRSVACVVGHDFGSMVAAYCALVRPDVFRSLVMMSFPFDGPPAIPFGTAGSPATAPPPSPDAELAALSPPRRDSMAFFASRGAEADMLHPPQGLHAFLRAYYHVKSADWPGNRPHPLASGSAAELATWAATHELCDDSAAVVLPIACA